MTTSVYRLRDGDGLLLYVGCSKHPHERVLEHRRRSWGGDIASVEVEPFATRAAAAQAEFVSMLSERPMHNRALQLDRRTEASWLANCRPRGSVIRRLADLFLDGKLDEFITTRRSQRPPRAWRLIARDLWEATDGRLDVTYETLRSWYPEDREPEAAAS